MKYYEVWYYQERGFASESHRVASFLNKDNAEEYAKKMNHEDKDAMYDVYEREFKDGEDFLNKIELVENIKKKLKEHPVEKKYFDMLVEDGSSEEEAMDILIGAWLDLTIYKLEHGGIKGI